MYAAIIYIPLMFLATMVQASPDGELLYQRHCAVCHGNDGNGGVGVPLALPDFQNTVSDDYLHRTIRHGRPGRVMPAFTQLSDAEIGAIVKYTRRWLSGEAPTFHAERIKGDIVRGKALYGENCADCHGDNGEGGTGTGVTFSRPRNLPIVPPALNNAGFLASAQDQMIKASLMNGREGTPMSSFLDEGLSEKDIDDIVAYVRSFEKDVAARQRPPLEDEAATIIYESPYSLEETIESIKRAAVGKNFRIIRVQTLDDGLVEKGKEDPRQVIIYFCNFEFLNKALAVDPRVGLFLPCRVTASEENGKVKVFAINPMRLGRFFNNDELDKMCAEMHELYLSLIEEATL